MGAEDADDTENLDDTVAAGGTTVGADLVVYAGGAVDGMDALDGTAGAAESCSVVAAGGLASAVRWDETSVENAGGAAFCSSEAFGSVESDARSLFCDTESPDSCRLMACLYFVRSIGSHSRDCRGGVPAEDLTSSRVFSPAMVAFDEPANSTVDTPSGAGSFSPRYFRPRM